MKINDNDHEKHPDTNITCAVAISLNLDQVILEIGKLSAVIVVVCREGSGACHFKEHQIMW